MKLYMLLFSLVSSFALAESATVTVEGMHCSACKKMITKTVCDDKDLKAGFESCEVKLTDAKKQLGEIKIVTKKDSKIDMTKVETAVKAAGDDYKVIKKDIK